MAIGFDSIIDYSTTVTVPSNISTMLIGLEGDIGSDSITNMTVAGNSATLVGKILNGGTNGRYTYLYVYYNPPSGSQSLTTTGSTAGGKIAFYTGGGSIQNAKTASTGDSTTSLATTSPATNDNSWIISYAGLSNGNSLSAGSGTTFRSTGSGNGFFDNNAAITPPSLKTLNMNISGSGAGIATIQCELTLPNIPTIGYLQTTGSATDLTTYTFSSQNFGGASSDRQIICAVSGRTQDGSSSGNVVSSITIGGVSATIAVQGQNSGNTQCIAIANVPTGATGDVVVVFAETMGNADISLYRCTGISTTVSDSGTSTANTGTYDLDVPANGVAVAMMKNDDGSQTATWAGLVETYDEEDAAVNDITGSAAQFSTTQTNLTVSCTWSGTPGRPIYVVASFGPTITTNTGDNFMMGANF